MVDSPLQGGEASIDVVNSPAFEAEIFTINTNNYDGIGDIFESKVLEEKVDNIIVNFHYVNGSQCLIGGVQVVNYSEKQLWQ